MPSQALIGQIDHFIEVRERITRAGFVLPGDTIAKLTPDEMREQELGRQAGVSAADVADEFIARRRIAASTATVAA